MDVKTLSDALGLSKICWAVKATGKALPSEPWISLVEAEPWYALTGLVCVRSID